jgi:hypothetical protein
MTVLLRFALAAGSLFWGTKKDRHNGGHRGLKDYFFFWP